MKFHKLLRTRDFNQDYRWVYHPDYIDTQMEDQFQYLTRKMMYKADLNDYLMAESLRNIYYIYGEDGSVLVRSGFSDNMDYQARKIYSVEGFACPPEQNRLFWYALPYLIDRMIHTGLLRDDWVEDGGQDWVDFPELKEENLFKDMYEPGSVWMALRDRSACMNRLFQDVQASGKMYSFVYGTREKDFYKVPVERFYTTMETETAMCQIVRTVPYLPLNPVIDVRDSTYRIAIETECNRNRYQLCLIAIDGHRNIVAQTQELTFDLNGLDLAQIQRAKKAMSEKMKIFGYDRRKD